MTSRYCELGGDPLRRQVFGLGFSEPDTLHRLNLFRAKLDAQIAGPALGPITGHSRRTTVEQSQSVVFQPPAPVNMPVKIKPNATRAEDFKKGGAFRQGMMPFDSMSVRIY